MITLLTKAEAKSFLSAIDLNVLEGDITSTKLRAGMNKNGDPYITVRDKHIHLFDALELVGAL